VRSLAGLVFAVVAFCGAVYAETLTPRAFTDEFVRAVAAALPSSTVTSKRELELTINDPGGVERTIVLHNAYRLSRSPAPSQHYRYLCDDAVTAADW